MIANMLQNHHTRTHASCMPNMLTQQRRSRFPVSSYLVQKIFSADISETLLYYSSSQQYPSFVLLLRAFAGELINLPVSDVS